MGHLLSIPHNKNHSSVMFTYYPINVFQNYSFSNEEIDEARKLYVQLTRIDPRDETTQTEATVHQPATKDGLCDNNYNYIFEAYGQLMASRTDGFLAITGHELEASTVIINHIEDSEVVEAIVTVNNLLFILQQETFVVTEGNLRLVRKGRIQKTFGNPGNVIGAYFNTSSSVMYLFAHQYYIKYENFNIDATTLKGTRKFLRNWHPELRKIRWMTAIDDELFFIIRMTMS
ncbi:hypothetical protein B4U80_12174 [Leptotrombidium deliense]|uniref:Uncharacterized protein n=1 Tax=Leptotrombidium deliense TaxID=299467 RepID=A0A443RX95_9ACAR|nr:hypothetical protein B4U80_12174 [Leptotrombidium deliense]